MAHNGITSLNDYDLTVMHEWEIEKVKKAIEKRKRRDKREEKEERIRKSGKSFKYKADKIYQVEKKKIVGAILTDSDFPEIKGSHPGDAHSYD